MNDKRSTHSTASLDAMQARFALRVTARLTEQSDALPQDISERLRVAREQALLRARAARAEPVAASTPMRLGSVLAWFGSDRDSDSWWVKLGSVLPLVVLIAGLVLILDWHGNNQISAAAEIDASLLADDLPPAAYSDDGFVEFLKSPRD